LNLGYSHEFFEGYATRINIFAERRSGQPYSFNFDTAIFDPERDRNVTINPFGDERFFEDRVLLYVPEVNDPNVVFADGFDLASFNQFIADNGLEGYRGRALPRNTQTGDWWTRVDLRISQEIPGFLEDHRGEVFFVVQNLGNLLNDDWGTLRQVNFEFNEPVVTADIVDGQYQFLEFDGPRGQVVDTPASSWTARVGINYRF
jgi:hypothetical protein